MTQAHTKRAFLVQSLLACLVVLFISLPTWAYGNGDNTVTVGYVQGFGLIENMNSLSSKGYGYDVLEATKKYSDLTYEYTPIAESEILSALNAGTIELYGPMSYSDARNAQYAFTRDFGVQQIMLVAAESASFLLNDTTAFNGQAVTSLTSLGYDAYVTSYASKNGISLPLSSVSSLADFNASTNQLSLAGGLMTLTGKKSVANLGLDQLYFVAKSGNTSLVQAVNAALSNLEINEPTFMSATYSKYFQSSSVSKPTLSVAESSLVSMKNTFSVGYLSNHFPVESIGDSGYPEGIMIDLMKMLEKEANIKFNFEAYSLDSSVNLANYDLNIAWVSNQDFSQYYTQTNPFSTSTTLMMLAKEGLSNPYTSVSKIGMLPFTTIDTNELKSAYTNSTFTTYDSYAELAKALNKGDIDGALLSSLSCDYVLSLADDNFTTYVTRFSFPIPVFVNNNLGDDYVNLLNTLIQRLDEAEVEKAFLSQVSKYRAEPTLFDIIITYWYIYAVVILLISGGFLALFIYLQRKKQVAVTDALNYDEITGLVSELKFISDVESLLKNADDEEYLIITLDIDHFSLIRKQYGYEKSNDFLKKIGETLEHNYPEDAVIARSKADLFLICTEKSANGRLVNNDNVIEAAQGLLASTHPISISQGVYYIEDDSMPVQLMVDYCNMARLQGKSVYGLTVNEYTKELDAKRELNNSIVLRMERALVGKELIPYYQPKVHLKSSKITGCEALVRWCDIDAELEIPKVKYMPDEFIPLFEENGFIAKLDYHIFDEICSFIRRNIKEVGLIPKISINLSGITLLKSDLRQQLLGSLEKYRVLPADIDLEITESAFTQYPKESADKVRMLRSEGFTISMDDFGTGASSLNRLKDMDITTIKLDKAFLDYNLAELKGSVIIGNMINMARRLGLEVVAEGVETKEQLSALKMLHCDMVQGYYYSRPVNEIDLMYVLHEPVCLADTERKKRRAAEAAAAAAEAAAGIIP